MEDELLLYDECTKMNYILFIWTGIGILGSIYQALVGLVAV